MGKFVNLGLVEFYSGNLACTGPEVGSWRPSVKSDLPPFRRGKPAAK